MRTFTILLLSLAILPLCATPGVARQIAMLDGDWQCVPGDITSPPAPDALWQTTTVPSPWEWSPQGPHCLWYRTRFYIPSSWAGLRIVLRFGGIKYSQQIYVNGKKVGGHLGGFEPTEYDVTDQVLFGRSNDLLVAAQDWTSLIAKDAQVTEPGAGATFGSWVKDGILAPIGSRGWEFGIWESVSVETRSRVWIENVFVITSLREQMVRVQVTLRNGGTQEDQTTVTARVSRGGQGPRFAPETATVRPKQTATVTLEAPWPDAHLWSPQDPHLYYLVVGARTAGRSDSQEVRFGFREFWIENDRFLLNGVPISLLATASHPLPQYDDDPSQAYEIARSAGCVAMRLHAQPWPQQWYDVADETGMLLIAESALWCLSPNYAMTQDAFWRNARDHIAAQVKHQRNHPSIIIWSAENELLLCGGAAVQGAEEKVGALADLIREFDPTRAVMFEGDADPAGKADIVNLHYPHEFPRWNLWPETAYWLEMPTRLDTYPEIDWEWDRAKPLYLGEFLWVPPSQVDAASVFLGDDAYPDPESSRLRAKAAAWEMQIIAARDAGVSGMCPWTLWETGEFPNPASEANWRAYQGLAAFTREPATGVFAGTVVDRTITVVNDSGFPRSFELRWRLAPEAGGWEVTGSTPMFLDCAARARVKAALAIPALDEPVVPARYTVELLEDDTVVFADSQQWKVYGRQPLTGRVPSAPKRLALYDPSGDTARILSDLGVDCLKLDDKTAPRTLHLSSVAVVGRDAFQPTAPRVAATGDDSLLADLHEFVRGGGTLLVFEQSYYPPSLIPLSLSDHSATIAFPRSLHHPALAGLEAADLAHWLPDGTVARKEITKPTTGGFTAIVDSGGPRGLETCGLGELHLGDGRMILCQLDVTTKYGMAPAATLLMRNLLACASQRPQGGVATAAFCSDGVAAKLDAVGLRYQRLPTPLAEADLRPYRVLLIGDLSQLDEASPRLASFVRQGGRVVLHRISSASVEAVSNMAGQPVVLWGDHAAGIKLADPSGPAEGMSNQEFAWFTLPALGASAPRPLSARIADSVLVPPYREVGPAAHLEAESMTVPIFGAGLDPTEEGFAVALYSNTQLRTDISVSQPGPYLFSLRVRGTPAAGGYPELSLRLDDLPIGFLVAGREDWETASLLVNLPAGDHSLGLAFDNDLYAPPEDRNLWIDWVAWAPVQFDQTALRLHTFPGLLASVPDGRGLWVIDQVRWEAPGDNDEKALRYLAALLTNLRCEFTFEGGEVIQAAQMEVKNCEVHQRLEGGVQLATSGLLETEVDFADQAEYVFAVFARGTPLDGTYPHIELRLDGRSVGVLKLQGGSWQTQQLEAKVAPGRHKIGLAFINDAYEPPQDRNLTVARLTIRAAEASHGT